MLRWLVNLIFHRKEKKIRRRNAQSLSFISFLLGFTDSFFAYVLSLYFAEVLGSDNVGGFYLVTYGIIFGLLWFLHRIMRKVGGSVLMFFLAALACVVLSATLTVVPVGWFGAVFLILMMIFLNVAWVSLDVVLEHVSDDGITGRVRGLYLTVMNAGILLAPFFATRVIDWYGFGGVFFSTTLGFAIVLAVAIVLLRNCDDCVSAKMRIRSAWKKMIEDKNLFHIYGVSFGLDFFYVITTIYTPIHLVRLGFSWEEIGLLLTVMLLPFIFLQYPLGVLADKRFGEKEFLLVGIVIAGLSVLAFGLFPSSSLLFWGVLLFISRIGAAAIEILSESYFYKHVEAEDDDIIALFRTTFPAANIIGAILAVPLLFFFPLSSVFFLAAGVLILLSLPAALNIEDTR